MSNKRVVKIARELLGEFAAGRLPAAKCENPLPDEFEMVMVNYNTEDDTFEIVYEKEGATEGEHVETYSPTYQRVL